MDKYKILIGGSIICLIFDNLPKILQLNTISSGLANRFTWYPLFLLFLLKVIEFYKEKTKLEIQEKNQLKFIGLLLCIFLICNIQGLLIYPYYDELLAGPLSQIEKLPHLLQFLQQHDVIVSVQNIFMSWIGVRAIKGTILNVIYTFGFSFIIYLIIKKEYPAYVKVLYKCTAVSICIISVYSCIELFYLAGNPVAKIILVNINPMLHPIAVEHGWWPKLLSEHQVRSVFSEPSRMGNYAAFALPFLWTQFLKAKKIVSLKAVSLIFYTFLIFMTKARTPVAMYWGLLGLFIVTVIVYTRKKYFRQIAGILTVSALSLLLSLSFMKIFMVQQQEVSVESYLSDNVGSLTKGNARSNGARYALIRSNFKTGIEHPVFGVGNQLTSSYTVHNFNEYDLQNREVQLWVRSFKEKGVLRYGLDAMNEYVSQFAQYGIIGLLVFLFPLFFILIQLFHKLKHTDRDEQLDTLAVTLSLIGSAVAGCNGSLTLLYTYWVILAYAYANVYQDIPKIQRLEAK